MTLAPYKNSKLRLFYRQLPKHLMVWATISLLLVFSYGPMYGVIIAFKDYRFSLGIWGSEWVGMAHFQRLFENPLVWRALRNTVTLSLLGTAFLFPAPILLALMFNELKDGLFKRAVQSISYLPNFVAMMVVVSLVTTFLRPSGLINNILISLGVFDRPFNFLAATGPFYPIVLSTELWKGVGWGTIIYLAAISAVDQEMIEASIIDGAKRLQQIRYIILPSISETIVILLILNISNILSSNFDLVFLLQNALNMSVSDTLDTFVFRMGIIQGAYSFTTAVGLLRSVVGFALLVLCNKVSRALTGKGIM